MLKKKKLKEVHLSRSLRIYQKASVAFVIFSFFLLLAVLYLSVSRATIHIEPVPIAKAVTVPFVVTPNPQLEGEISGYVLSKTKTKSQVFTISEEGAIRVEAKARGFVTLVNETGSPQPLVATTRLLSPDQVLFRLDEGTTVPAKGEVVVAVTADKIGADGNIPATQFTIPGLPASLQKSIYGVSLEAMVGGVEYQRAITEDDLAQAKSVLESALVEELKAELRGLVPSETFSGDTYQITIKDSATTIKPGDVVGAIPVKLTAEVTGIYYDRASITDFVEQALFSSVEDGYMLAFANLETISATIKGVDAVNERATIEVALDGVARIDSDNPLFERDRFVGKPEKEVLAILEANKEIERATIAFSPFWIKRMPTLKDHIELRIKEPSVGGTEE